MENTMLQNAGCGTYHEINLQGETHGQCEIHKPAVADRYRHLRGRPTADCARPVTTPRRQLHALSEDAQLSLERHRADVQYAASDVREAVHGAGDGGG